MRIDITYQGRQRVHVPPAGVYFIGITVICNDLHFSVLDYYSDDDSHACDEEIVLDEGFKILIRYYKDERSAEIRQEFVGFEKMKCVEIKSPAFEVLVTV